MHNSKVRPVLLSRLQRQGTLGCVGGLAWLALASCKPDPASTEPLVVPPVPTPPLALADTITAPAMMAHLEVLQDIADANAGTRQFATSGYLESVDYLEDQLQHAGFTTERQTYVLTRWDLVDAALDLTGGAPLQDWAVFTYSASGSATAAVFPVDLELPPHPTENHSTSGCEIEDFDGFLPGSIALIQRGTCPFATKVALAEAAGATAVLVFNEGQPDRSDVLQGVLDSATPSTIPAVGLSFAAGEALAASPGVEVSVFVEALREDAEDVNLLAELPGTDPDAGVIQIGAHLDSVQAGPGINDNGSGSAFLLELALQASNQQWQPVHPVRFSWWGAEEEGLIGSSRWVYDETTGEPRTDRLDALDAYLNFDMMASSNGARFVYDGDNSDIADGGGSAASGRIETIFLDWFDDEGLESVPEAMFVASDSWWFILEGVPTGGLFSGATTAKPAGLVGGQGGTAGVAYDACYHASCDRLDQIDPVLYEELARAGAHAVQQLAESPESPRVGGSSARVGPGRPVGCHEHIRWDR